MLTRVKALTVATALMFAMLAAPAFNLVSDAAANDEAACREKFARYFVNRTKMTGVKIHVTQQIKGAPTTENWNYQLGPGHWMSEGIKPANLPWTLVHDNVMYSSSDKGKSWKKVRTLDSAQRASDVEANLKATIATAKNFACGTEEIGGVAHEKIAADYAMTKYKTDHRDTYWVNPKTGWIAKATTKTVGKGFEMFITQVIEAVPDLKLPTP